MTSSLAFLAGRDGSPKTDFHEWFDDFDDYSASEWVITETGSGTRAVADAKDGILVVTNAASDNDVNSLQWSGLTGSGVAETWKFVEGKRLYFGARLKISDATESDLKVGLHITDTTPIGSTVTDGIFFRKDDGDADLDGIVVKDSTSTGSPTAMASMADDTYTVLEFYYDGTTAANGGMIQFFKDGVNVGNVDLDNVPDNEELAISFAHQNGEGVAKILSVDWIRVVQERGT